MASGILDVKRARRLDKTGRREAEAESEGEDDSGGESDTDGPDDGPVEGGKAKTDATGNTLATPAAPLQHVDLDHTHVPVRMSFKETSSSGAGSVKTAWLGAHNDNYRKMHGAPDLLWDDAIAHKAKVWCDYLTGEKNAQMAHPHGPAETAKYLVLEDGTTKLGQNIAMLILTVRDEASFDKGEGGDYDRTVRKFAAMWHDEVKVYVGQRGWDVCGGCCLFERRLV